MDNDASHRACREPRNLPGMCEDREENDGPSLSAERNLFFVEQMATTFEATISGDSMSNRHFSSYIPKKMRGMPSRMLHGGMPCTEEERRELEFKQMDAILDALEITLEQKRRRKFYERELAKHKTRKALELKGRKCDAPTNSESETSTENDTYRS